MRVTVSCPADGVVEVTVRDLDLVVVRSGSDVQATYRCPLCGSPVLVGSELSCDLIAWVAAHVQGSMSIPDERHPGECRRGARVWDDAYVEYFRRELAAADAVEDMVALMDLGERRRQDRTSSRRR
jgi:hypothetical protein